MPWKWEMVPPERGVRPRSVLFGFSVLEPGYSDAGYFTGLPVKLLRHIRLSANLGSEIDPYPESDVSGLTGGRVVALSIALSDGSTVEVAPQKAPARLFGRYPFLRGIRFFEAFYGSDLEPERIVGLGAQGQVVFRTGIERLHVIGRPGSAPAG